VGPEVPARHGAGRRADTGERATRIVRGAAYDARPVQATSAHRRIVAESEGSLPHGIRPARPLLD